MKNLIGKDKKIARLSGELSLLRRSYKFALIELRKVEALLGMSKSEKIITHTIKPNREKNDSEATAFAIASDWHVDEVVRPMTVNGLNHFTPRIARKRADRFFANTVALLNIFKRDVRIENLVVPMLGDFISGNIHEELLENNSMLPVDAIVFVKELWASGIDFLLKNTDVRLTFIAHCGNHSRLTSKVHNSTETGNSLETLLYTSLNDRYTNNKRVEFVISPGYHSYLKIYGKIIRFHHGHAIRYYGGVGGIYIPVNKAHAQWNKLKWADLSVFGHFHQRRDGGDFLCNGSLVGYNTYALSIKADFEKPQQTFFLWDKKRGKTIVAPIMLE